MWVLKISIKNVLIKCNLLCIKYYLGYALERGFNYEKNLYVGFWFDVFIFMIIEYTKRNSVQWDKLKILKKRTYSKKFL